jgi:beta-lactamase class A
MTLKDTILAELAAMEGHAGFYYKNLVTGETWGFNEKDVFSAASVTKLPLMAVILEDIRDGKKSFRDIVEITDAQKVGGCGTVQHMTGTVSLDVESLGKMMISVSDNTATNALFRYAGGAAELHGRFDDFGWTGSRFYREYYSEGPDNCIVPEEMGILLEKMFRRQLVNEELDAWLENILQQQQIEHKMCGMLPPDVIVAHKTGDTSTIANDVGVVYTKEPFVACFAFNGENRQMHEYEHFIRRTTLALAEANGI